MNELIKFLSKFDSGSQVISIYNYTNNFGEKAHYTLSFRNNYKDLVRLALHSLEHYTPRVKDCVLFDYGTLNQAKKELTDSLKESLRGQNSRYTLEGIYTPPLYQGKQIEGIKIHLQQRVLHLDGLLVHKDVIIPARYPEVNSHPLTIAKDFLRNKTVLCKYRQFKLLYPKLRELEIKNHIFKSVDCKL